MIAGALIFLVETAFGLFTVALLLRFYLQWLRAAHRNPISDFVNALTDFIVKPARRVIPGLWGLDLATLLLAWFVQILELVVVLLIKGYNPAAGLAALTLLSMVLLIKTMIYILMFALIVQAVMSWVNPYTPLAPLLARMVRPVVAPFQRFIRPIGNVDLTPLVAIIALQLVLMLPIAYLEALLGRGF